MSTYREKCAKLRECADFLEDEFSIDKTIEDIKITVDGNIMSIVGERTSCIITAYYSRRTACLAFSVIGDVVDNAEFIGVQEIPVRIWNSQISFRPIVELQDVRRVVYKFFVAKIPW